MARVKEPLKPGWVTSDLPETLKQMKKYKC